MDEQAKTVVARVTSRGRVTLPKQLRAALHLQPGSKVEFTIEDGRVTMRGPSDLARRERWIGYLRDSFPCSSVDELIDDIRGGPFIPEEHAP